MIGELSAERRLLLEVLRRRKAGDLETGPLPPPALPGDRGPFSLISAADRALLPPDLEDAYPLASMQLGMLYHTELTRDEELPAYHNVFLFDIDSAVDPGRFAAAVQQVVARHPILRTSFDLRRFSEPLQLSTAGCICRSPASTWPGSTRRPKSGNSTASYGGRGGGYSIPRSPPCSVSSCTA